MCSRHPVPVDTVSFSEKPAIRSEIQTYGQFGKGKGVSQGREGEQLGMDATFDAFVTVTLHLEFPYAPIDLHSSISNLGLAHYMHLTENEHGQCTVNAWVS